MRRLAISALLLAAGCAGGLDLGSLVDPAEAQRRGAVEVAVKSTYPGILAEIDAGGGPAIAAAMDAAGVPPQDRSARLAQMGGDLGLFEANPGALVTALMLYGG
jgi:hypothetical protein